MAIKISYVGLSEMGGLGERAVKQALESSMSKYFIAPSGVHDDPHINILGGCPVLPDALTGRFGYEFRDADYNIGIGVGVTSPSFDDVQESYISESDFSLIDEYDFDRISVSGPMSRWTLRSHGCDPELTGDPAMLLEPNEYYEPGSKEVIVALQGPSPKYSNDGEYLKHLRRLMKEMSDEYKFIFLVCNEADRGISAAEAEKVDNSELVFWDNVGDPDRIINHISEAELVIGERMYANVLAASAGVPFIYLANRPKAIDFCSLVNESENCMKITSINYEWLSNRFETLTGDAVKRKEIRAVTRDIRRSLEDEVTQTVKRISEIEDKIESRKPSL